MFNAVRSQSLVTVQATVQPVSSLRMAHRQKTHLLGAARDSVHGAMQTALPSALSEHRAATPHTPETLPRASGAGAAVREGIRSFIENSKKLGKSEKTAHSLYVQGMDQNGAKVSTKEHLKRGAALSALTDMWLYTWGEDESA